MSLPCQPALYLQSHIYQVLLHGFETRAPRGPEAGLHLRLISKQDKGSEKGHTITHTYQKPLVAPPEGNTGTEWKPSFHECLGLGSLIGRAEEKTMRISAYEMLYIAVSSFWQTSTTQVQCSEARAGFQSWTTLLHSAACCLHTRRIVSSILESMSYSDFDNQLENISTS